MKRLFSLLLCLMLLLSFFGCDNDKMELQDQVVFYYLRADIQSDTTFGDADSVIVPEIQESISRNNNIAYFLKLYLTGPSDSRLRSPFPADMKLISVRFENNVFIVTFTETLAGLTDMELTKACACIAMTCFGLTDSQTISIQTESETIENRISINISREDLALEDLTTLNEDGG